MMSSKKPNKNPHKQVSRFTTDSALQRIIMYGNLRYQMAGFWDQFGIDDLLAVDSKGHSVLYQACVNGEVRYIPAELRKKIPPDAWLKLHDRGDTPLFSACFQGFLDYMPASLWSYIEQSSDCDVEFAKKLGKKMASFSALRNHFNNSAYQQTTDFLGNVEYARKILKSPLGQNYYALSLFYNSMSRDIRTVPEIRQSYKERLDMLLLQKKIGKKRRLKKTSEPN